MSYFDDQEQSRLRGLVRRNVKLLEEIDARKAPAAVIEREGKSESGEIGLYADLDLDAEAFGWNRRSLASLWRESYLEVKNGILVTTVPDDFDPRKRPARR